MSAFGAMEKGDLGSVWYLRIFLFFVFSLRVTALVVFRHLEVFFFVFGETSCFMTLV